jgi:spermidine synthase
VTHAAYFPYVHVLDVTRYLFSQPGDLLLIGLGGGSVAKAFARHEWRVDSVEIDQAVTELAYRDFGLEASDTTVFHMDGRRYLTTTDRRYDLIIVDAFGSSSIPFHLVTREAFALLASRLAPGGAVAINVESVGWRDIVVRSLAATLKREFSEVVALPIAEPPNTLGNLVLVAANRELQLTEELPPTLSRFSDAYPKNHAWDNRFEPDTREASVLTDDLNPIDIWSERINLEARKNLHAYFERGLSW